MSIPRTAINRPVTMFMLCGVIILLGTISLDAPAGRPDAGRHVPELTVRVSTRASVRSRSRS